MFLVTTADQRFWKTDENILFLGEWCLLYKDKVIWDKLSYQVFPYPWRDAELRSRDFHFLQLVYEKFLIDFSANLNRIHKTDFSSRYWRILVGPWLFFIIYVLYERKMLLEAVARVGGVSSVRVFPADFPTFVTQDFSRFHSHLIRDEYNSFLYSIILHYFKFFPMEVVPSPEITPPISTLDPGSNLRGLAKNSIFSAWRRLYRFVPGRFKKLLFLDDGFHPAQAIRLFLSLGQIPLLQTPSAPNFSVLIPRDNLRSSWKFIDATSIPFESFLQRTLPKLIPLAYLEGYDCLRQKVKRVFPKLPEVLFCSTGFYSNEFAKLLAAEMAEEGKILVGCPHGGVYGTSSEMIYETHETSFLDFYCTWGWPIAASNHARIKSLTPPKLIRTQRVSPMEEGYILWGSNSVPRYFYLAAGIPIGPQGRNHIEFGLQFLGFLPEEIRRVLMLRLYPIDFGWNELERYREQFPSLRLYQGSIPFYKQLKESRLFLCDNNGTTYLETISINFPTMIFWDTNLWPIRDDAWPFFLSLKKVGVFHTSVQSAVRQLSRIWRRPIEWWLSRDVQNQVGLFRRRFALTSRKWISVWHNFFQDITFLSGGLK